MTADDIAEFAATLGQDTGGADLRQGWRIQEIVKAWNARGGIAGRTIVPVFHDTKVADIVSDPNAAAEAACTALTEDNQVVAAITTVGYGDSALAACFAKHQTPLIFPGQVVRPQAIYEKFAPYLYSPTQPSIDQEIPARIERGTAHGYFSGWNTDTGQPGPAPVKVGIYAMCCTVLYGRDSIAVARAALARRGIEVGATFQGSDLSDAGKMSQDAASAVLKFKAAGVTHVLPATAPDMSMFARAAQSQGYRPRYLVSTPVYAHAMELGPEVLNGALGAGYEPLYDVSRAHEPGDTNSFKVWCRQLGKRSADVDADSSDRTRRAPAAFFTEYCDGINFLSSTVARGGLSAAGIQAGARALESLPSASVFSMTFAAHPFHGGSAVRALGYRNNCECFVYLDQVNQPL